MIFFNLLILLLSIYLSICLSIYFLFIFLLIYLLIYLFIYFFIYFFISLFLYFFSFLFINVLIYFLAYLFIVLLHRPSFLIYLFNSFTHSLLFSPCPSSHYSPPSFSPDPERSYLLPPLSFLHFFTSPSPPLFVLPLLLPFSSSPSFCSSRPPPTQGCIRS